MLKNAPWSQWMLDVAGGGFLVIVLGAFLWMTLLRTDESAVTLAELERAVQTARNEIDGLTTERDRQRTTLKSRRAELQKSGQLPAQAPVEEYFRTLSDLAARHRLRVVRHNPLNNRAYPGLLERRYAYEVTGSLPDITEFFQAIEASEFWADIAYLRIDKGVPSTSTANERIATLTISVFSALPRSPQPGTPRRPTRG